MKASMLVVMASKPLVSPFARPQDIDTGLSLPEYIFYYAPGALFLSLGVAIAIVEIAAPAFAIRWRQRLLRHRFFNPVPPLAETFDRVLGLDQPNSSKAQRNLRAVGVFLLLSMILMGYVWLAVAP